jgi:hypothetical protein
MWMLAEFQLPSINDFATWVASWLEPLSKTGLGFIKWEAQSRGTGAYIAILLVLALLVGRALMRRRRKVAVFVAALLLMLMLLLVNVVLSISNNHLTEQHQILLWRDDVWNWAYALFCASIPCFIVTTTYLLGLPDSSPPTSTAGGSSNQLK